MFICRLLPLEESNLRRHPSKMIPLPFGRRGKSPIFPGCHPRFQGIAKYSELSPASASKGRLVAGQGYMAR